MGQTAAKFGAPVGNTNGYRGQLFNDHLRKILTRNDRKALVELCESLVADAIAGDNVARQIVIDRVDGKANQSIDITARRGNDLEGMTTLELQAEIVKRAYLLTNQSHTESVVHTIDPSPDPAVLVSSLGPESDRGE